MGEGTAVPRAGRRQRVSSPHFSSSTPPPPAYTEKSRVPFGTGPLSDSATVGSGGNECQYQVSVSIQQNGDCTFSGYYENRGNWTFPNFGTAPPQGFIVGSAGLDEAGRGYTFAYTGEVPSAPQQGAVAQWSIARNNPAIAKTGINRRQELRPILLVQQIRRIHLECHRRCGERRPELDRTERSIQTAGSRDGRAVRGGNYRNRCLRRRR